MRKDCRKVLSVKKSPIASNRESWTAREYKDFYKSKYIIKSFGLRARSSIRWENSQFFLSNGSVKTRLDEKGTPLHISHRSDFRKYFPDVDLYP